MSTTLRSLVVAGGVALSLTQSAAGQEARQASSPPVAAPVERPPIVPLPAADAQKFLGDYDIGLSDGSKLPLRIFIEDGALRTFTEEGAVMAQAEGQSVVPLRYIGNDTFGADFDPALRLTFAVENGRVTGAKLLQGGVTAKVTRRQ